MKRSFGMKFDLVGTISNPVPLNIKTQTQEKPKMKIFDLIKDLPREISSS